MTCEVRGCEAPAKVLVEPGVFLCSGHNRLLAGRRPRVQKAAQCCYGFVHKDENHERDGFNCDNEGHARAAAYR